MGRAIAVAFLVVVLSIGFVLLQLWTRRSAAAPAPARRQQMFVTRDDGSVYAVSLQLTQFEKRLMEEEERTRRLLDELATLRTERAMLDRRVEELQEEVRRLRRQVTPPATPPGPQPEDPAPNPPDGVPVVPEPPVQPGPTPSSG